MALDRRTLLQTTGATAVAAAVLPRGIGAAAQDATASAAAPSGELIIGKAQEAVGLDPAAVTAAASFQLFAPVYQQLVRFDADNQPQPYLADSWEATDETTYVFKLHPGVVFHNGKALTAEDVKFSFERIKTADPASPWASQLEPIAEIEATDETTVTIKLAAPYGPLLATLAADYCAIVPSDAGDLQQTMIGTGPFSLTEYTQDVTSVFTANADYWEEGLPKVATISYPILPDEAARLAAIRTGEIGMTTLADAASVELAQGEDSLQVITQETTDYYLLGLNTQVEPLTNVAVRQALSLAVDRQGILDAVFLGQGTVSGPIVPTLGDWATPIADLPNYARDVDRAKELLAEANLADGFELTIMASPLYPEFINIALVLQEQLGEVGVTVNLEQVEWGTFIERWSARDFQSFVSFNGSGNDPDRALYPVIHTGGSVNASQFSDTAIDALLEEARASGDSDLRHELYRQAEQLIAEAAPALFLNTRTAYFALLDTVQGFAPNPIETWETLKAVTVEA